MKRILTGAVLALVLAGVALAASGESLAAFEGRCILGGGVAPRSNTPGILGRRALPARRLVPLGATPDFHNGLQGQATLTGKWQGETKNGSQVVFDATVTKTELTGTLTVDGEPNAISEGKVLKNTFSFVARAEAFAGELAGDQVKIWMERRGPDSAAILKRMKTDKK